MIRSFVGQIGILVEKISLFFGSFLYSYQQNSISRSLERQHDPRSKRTEKESRSYKKPEHPNPCNGFTETIKKTLWFEVNPTKNQSNESVENPNRSGIQRETKTSILRKTKEFKSDKKPRPKSLEDPKEFNIQQKTNYPKILEKIDARGKPGNATIRPNDSMIPE